MHGRLAGQGGDDVMSCLKGGERAIKIVIGVTIANFAKSQRRNLITNCFVSSGYVRGLPWTKAGEFRCS